MKLILNGLICVFFLLNGNFLSANNFSESISCNNHVETDNCEIMDMEATCYWTQRHRKRYDGGSWGPWIDGYFANICGDRNEDIEFQMMPDPLYSGWENDIVSTLPDGSTDDYSILVTDVTSSDAGSYSFKMSISGLCSVNTFIILTVDVCPPCCVGPPTSFTVELQSNISPPHYKICAVGETCVVDDTSWKIDDGNGVVIYPYVGNCIILPLEECIEYEVQAAYSSCGTLGDYSEVETISISAPRDLDCRFRMREDNVWGGIINQCEATMCADQGDAIIIQMRPDPFIAGWQNFIVCTFPNGSTNDGSFILNNLTFADAGTYHFVFTDPVTGCVTEKDFELIVQDCTPCCERTGEFEYTLLDCNSIEVCINGFEGCEDTWFGMSILEGETGTLFSNPPSNGGGLQSENCYLFTGLNPGYHYMIDAQVLLTGECGNTTQYFGTEGYVTFPEPCSEDCCTSNATPTAEALSCTEVEVCIVGYLGCDDTFVNFGAYNNTTGENISGPPLTEIQGEACFTFTGLDPEHSYDFTAWVGTSDACGNTEHPYTITNFTDFPADCVTDCCNPNGNIEVNYLSCEEIQVCLTGYDDCDGTTFDFGYTDSNGGSESGQGGDNQSCFVFTGLDVDTDYNFTVVATLPDGCQNTTQSYDIDFDIVYEDCWVDCCDRTPKVITKVSGCDIQICIYGMAGCEGTWYSFQDLENNQTTGAVSNQCFTYSDLAPGTYNYIVLTGSTGCPTQTVGVGPISISEDCGIGDGDGKGDIGGFSNETSLRSSSAKAIVAIYPNPATEVVNIDINALLDETAVIRIMDISGKNVHTINQPLNAGLNKVSLNSSSIAKGVYVVQILSSSINHTQKLIIAK